MSRNKLEKEFIGSLKALCVRYGVKFADDFSGDRDCIDTDIPLVMRNNATLRKDEIFITLKEILEEVGTYR